MNENLLKILIPLLKDPDENVKKAAAYAIEQIEKKAKIIQLASSIKGQDKVTRLRIVNAMAGIKDDVVRDALKESANDEEPEIRAAAVKGLAMMKDGANLEIFVEKLKDPVKAVRLHAIMGLGLCGDKRATEFLIPLLLVQDIEVVDTALKAVAELKDKRVLEYVGRLLSHPHPLIRARACMVIGILGSE
jgi:HEAT repeat protein